MKKLLVLTLMLGLVSFSGLKAYGPTGHRTVAKIAQSYLSKKALKNIEKLLDGESLVNVSTFADDIKSDSTYDHTHIWHYVNVADGVPYQQAEKNPDGDLIFAINKCIAVLENKNSSKEEKVLHLKLLVHFVGDLHQPLHTGRGEDRGGNDIKLKWFGKSTNLHRVWDSDMIDFNRMSYTELSENMKRPPYLNFKVVSAGGVLDWYDESKKMSYTVYGSAKIDDDLSYPYNYKYYPVVKDQLNKAGIRLAKILEEIFG